MSARRRRRGADSDVHNDERWMASYMDMVTVLMCMFIVLFAMSSVDAEKFEALSNSLATGFGQEPSEHTDISEGYVVPADLRTDEPSDPSALDLARRELDRLLELRDRIDAGLAAQGLQDAVAYDIDDRGLTVRLVGAETYFEGNSVELSQKARAVLGVVGGVLGTVDDEVRVEGHADPHGSPGPFPTDWELASGRATQVVRFLVEQTGIAAPRAAAVGFGSARPVANGADEASAALNRRVDVVVLSDEPDAVRELLPQLYAGIGQQGAG
ncbi:flagellar motor protein MotB [Agromyces sp. G08B096]|uniref:Flagellar motor protein MotB n=1 Tax=Agromyces sp. G08B096 TaxID=3156399 RepID=A0AAU7W8K8_9MICO